MLGPDRVLVLGADAFLVYPYTTGQPVPEESSCCRSI
jgi:hypothetical protein